MIDVYDRIIPSDLQKEIDMTCYQSKYSFTEKSTHESKQVHGVCNIGQSVEFNEMFDYLYDAVPELKTSFEPIRPYINISAPRTLLDFHVDLDDGVKGKTFLLYCCMPDDYDISHGGGTEFYNEQKRTSSIVYPAESRGVVFDSRLLHRGLPYCSDRNRFTVAIKFAPKV